MTVRADLRKLRADLLRTNPPRVVGECWMQDDDGPRYHSAEVPGERLTMDEINARHARMEADGADVYTMILSRLDEPPAVDE
jgi:hypothetical protein